MADTVVGAVTHRPREGHEGWNVAGVVLACASAVVGIFFIVGAVALIDNDRDLAAHGMRTQGQVVEANADGWDKVTGRPQAGEGASRPTQTGDAAHATRPERPRSTASPAGATGAVCAGFRR